MLFFELSLCLLCWVHSCFVLDGEVLTYTPAFVGAVNALFIFACTRNA